MGARTVILLVATFMMSGSMIAQAQIYPRFTNPAAAASQRGAAAALHQSAASNNGYHPGQWAWSPQYGWTWFPNSWRPQPNPSDRNRMVSVIVGEDEDGNPIYQRYAIPLPANYYPRQSARPNY